MMYYVELSRGIPRYDLLREVDALCRDYGWKVKPWQSKMFWLVHDATGVEVPFFGINYVTISTTKMTEAEALRFVQPIIAAMGRASAGECVPIYSEFQREMLNPVPPT